MKQFRSVYEVALYVLAAFGAVYLYQWFSEVGARGGELDGQASLRLFVFVVTFAILMIGKGVEAAALFAVDERTKKLEEKIDKLLGEKGTK